VGHYDKQEFKCINFPVSHVKQLLTAGPEQVLQLNSHFLQLNSHFLQIFYASI